MTLQYRKPDTNLMVQNKSNLNMTNLVVHSLISNDDDVYLD